MKRRDRKWYGVKGRDGKMCGIYLVYTEEDIDQ